MSTRSFCLIEEEEGTSPHKIENPKILVADDDDSLRACIVELISLEGWEVVEARNGRETLEKVISEKPNLLLLDNRMPELTGTEAYKELRRQGLYLPVILITAAAEIEQLSKEFGIKCYLGKPFGIDELIKIVDHAIKHGSC
jgi:two-component system, response regulator, stage 0 sporulation protein F